MSWDVGMPCPMWETVLNSEALVPDNSHQLNIGGFGFSHLRDRLPAVSFITRLHQQTSGMSRLVPFWNFDSE